MTMRDADHDSRATADPALHQLLSGTGGSARRTIPTTTSATKASSVYQIHTYPTKIPPAAIEPFLLASTEPEAVVLDPFCGSGMTGLAALNTGRRALLADLAPGAVHLAHNHTNPVEPEKLAKATQRLMAVTATLESRLYASDCPECGRPETLRHMVWSDVHRCGRCDGQIRVWDQADGTGGSARALACPRCGNRQSRSGVRDAVSQPVEKAVACGSCARLQRGPAEDGDLALLHRIDRRKIKHWVPTVPLGPDREMYRRSALHLRSIKNVADFWTHRSKLALSELWNHIGCVDDEGVRSALQCAFTNTAWHATRMRRYNALGGQRPLTGTLYIPQLVAEGNVFEIFRHQVKQLSRFYATHPALDASDQRVVARQSSATDLSWLPSSSVDYVFTDPPFGANLFYGDCNVVWEAWLGDVTDLTQEIAVNRSLPAADGGKTVTDYEKLLGDAFAEMHRVMTPTARASVVFHNADDKVWSALLAATGRAGLTQTDVSVLDKVQRSMKGYKGRSGAELVPFYDLVITFATGSRVPTAHLNGAGDVALSAVRRHLEALPQGANDRLNQQRSLEYLYSLSVGAVITCGQRPTGLSFRALERLLRERFASDGRHYFAG